MLSLSVFTYDWVNNIEVTAPLEQIHFFTNVINSK